jgi:MerR family redox-sensitive transcriptional activator SoxR
MAMKQALMDISQVAARAGVAASALRFYESEGLIEAVSTPGRRRKFPRAVLRRLAFIRAAQAVGLSLDEIRAALTSLPNGRTPTAADWGAISSAWTPMLDARIAALTRMRNALTSCIGCGCLSLRRCAIYNPGDAAQKRGPGARYLIGDDPRAFMKR